MIRCLFAVGLALGVLGQSVAQAPSSWPMFGGTPARNMVNLTDKNIPAEWCVEEGKEKNIKWQALLGSKSYGGPVVVAGRVLVGTNNANPRDPATAALLKKLKPDQMKERDDLSNKSVLMCFEEKTGRFQWQTVHDAPAGAIFAEVVGMGLLSTPAVDDGKIYYVLPECVVVCADLKDGKALWQYDMRKKLKVTPYHCGNCSPLVVGNLVFLMTGNGLDNLGNVAEPEAPSFIALNKQTGELEWQSNLPGKLIIEGQWSNPAYAVIKGKPQVIFAGGDATIYSLEPETGKLNWEFRCYPKDAKDRAKANYIVATPVIYDDKVYVGMGVYPERDSLRFSHFLCIDATRTGDVSPGASLDKKLADKNSALVWSHGGMIEPRPKKDRSVAFGKTISTCAIHDGLVYIPEESGYMHCLDAKTGQRYWMHDFKAPIWGSAYCVDGKVFVGTEDGDMVVFHAGKQFKIIHKIEMEEKLHGTPVVAGGVLYVATMSKLFAIAAK
jgi:outer membrane protein assembly factor BamB